MAAVTKAVVLAAAIVIVTGTIVTGSGPHGGDDRAERLGFFVPTVARVHGISVIVLLGTVLLAVAVALRRRDGAPDASGAAGDDARTPRPWSGPVPPRLYRLLVVVVAQGLLGYVQYFSGVPVVLVGIHIFGATLVWAFAVDLALDAAGPGSARVNRGPGRDRRRLPLPSRA